MFDSPRSIAHWGRQGGVYSMRYKDPDMSEPAPVTAAVIIQVCMHSDTEQPRID